MPHLSFSQVKSFAECARRWKYGRESREPSHWAAVAGNAVHYAFEVALRAVATGQPVPGFEEMNNLLAANWHHLAADPSIRWGDVSSIYVHHRARMMVQALVEWGAFQHIQPASVDAIEQWFDVPLDTPGWIFKGRWDVVTATDTIIDLKTATEPLTQRDADRTLQAHSYYMGFKHLYGRWPKQFTLVVVAQNWKYDPEEPPTIETFTTTRTPTQVKHFRQMCNETARAIEAGIFVPNIGFEYCSSCPFTKKCRDEKSPATTSGRES